MTEQTTTRERTIQTETRTSGTPQQAWEALAEPERLLDWWIDRIEGKGGLGNEMLCEFEVLGTVTPLKIIESVPGERLVMEWSEPPGVVIWAVDIARESGETVVRIVASGFGEGTAWDELYDGMQHGMPGFGVALKRYLDRYFGERRQVASAFRTTANPKTTGRLLLEPGLNRWLTSEATVGQPGEQARLVLRDGRTLTGSVNTAMEGVLDMTCDQVDGSLLLMTYQNRVWAIVSGWGLSTDETDAIRGELGAALDALVALD